MTPAHPTPLEAALDALRRMPGDAGATLAHDAALELEALERVADLAEELIDAADVGPDAAGAAASIRYDVRQAIDDLHRRQRP